MTAVALLHITLAYLLGSISSAVLLCKLFQLPDPRQFGSGNPGATNVYRLGGSLPASLVMVFDLLKGAIPVGLGFMFNLPPITLGFVAVAACLGHMYPLYFDFKGGKGVATALGALMPLGLDIAGVLLIAWTIAVAGTGYSSVGAIASICLAPAATYLLAPDYLFPVMGLATLVLVKHHSNIYRLMKGKESKVWQRGKARE